MKYQKKRSAIILLADGTIFHGKAVGDKSGTAFGEVCFNTGMTGYQEIFTDPSYFGQLMVTTNAHIGNYGTNPNEVESDGVKIAGLICKNFSYEFSRTDATASLEDYLNDHKLFAISDVDTRALVSYIRDHGAMNAVISTRVDDVDALKLALAKVPSMQGLALAGEVSTKAAYYIGDSESNFKVAALDIGIKKNILRNLDKRGAYVKVFPHNTPFHEIESWGADGYFISNGPGDPGAMDYAVATVKEIIAAHKPLFGICLGHQLLARANDIPTFKMHHGHRGLNHPVKNLLTGKSEITTQNHGFGIDPEVTKQKSNLTISHINLNDHSIEGIKMLDRPAFSVQYHPESTPGPHDSRYLFDDFIAMIKNNH